MTEGTRLHLRLGGEINGLSHALKVAGQLSVFVPVGTLVPPFRVLIQA